MQNLPSAEVYDQEAKYMPWGILLGEILDYAVSNLRQGQTVLDLMCGTGHLLGRLAKARPDLTCVGLDMDGEYINFARDEYTHIEFVHQNALLWKSGRKFDAVLCTGGLHHIPWVEQPQFIAKLRTCVLPQGFALIGDPYIDDYSDELGRRNAAAKLGYEYLLATLEKDAPRDVIKATADLIANDVLAYEYKTSLGKIEPVVRQHFFSVEVHKTWPKEETRYGDYYFVCRA